MEKSIAEIMDKPANMDDIIRKAKEINARLQEVENMPEVEPINIDDDEPAE